MAAFVVNFGLTPREYYDLTLKERDAIVSVWNKAQRRH